MAASESVSSEKGDNLLVVETHLVEDVTRVLTVRAGSIGETTIWGRVLLLAINTSSSPVDNGAALMVMKNNIIAKRVFSATFNFQRTCAGWNGIMLLLLWRRFHGKENTKSKQINK